MKFLFEYVKAVFEALLDAVLPLRARTRRTRTLRGEDIELSPSVHTLLGLQITTLMPYDGIARDIIQSLKYDGSGHAARLCADVLADYLREEIAGARLFSQQRILLVPMPLYPTRERERGFNQITLILKSLSQEFHDGTLCSIQTSVLSRTRHTGQQTKLSRSERLSNVAGAFVAVNAEHVRDTHIYLIDDVATTGATLVNAAGPLRHAGAKVTLIALARA